MTLSATSCNATFCSKEQLVINGFVYHQNIPQYAKTQRRNQTMFHESDILSDSEKQELKQLISPTLYMRDVSFKTTQLIFNSKIHGFTHKSFYKQCSNKPNTLILIQAHPTLTNNYTDNKILFGAFTTKQWTETGEHVEDEDAFLYRLRANEYGTSIFPIEKYKQFALYQSFPPDYTDNNDNILFYFGQPVSLLLSENSNQNYNSYVSGGVKSNYQIPYKGSIIGLPNTQLMCCFKVINFEVFQIK